MSSTKLCQFQTFIFFKKFSVTRSYYPRAAVLPCQPQGNKDFLLSSFLMIQIWHSEQWRRDTFGRKKQSDFDTRVHALKCSPHDFSEFLSF